MITRTCNEESLIAQLVDEFTNRLHRGDHPQIEEYASEYPDIADELRQVLPAVEVMYHMADDSHPLSEEASDDLEEADQPRGCLGDYRILREIGRGGMGVVYEAEQISLQRRVALKVLPFAAVLDPRQLQRFKNEALAAAQLKHPHIVGVISVGCERAVHFYAMEYVEGKTLADVIAELRDDQLPSVTDAKPSVGPATGSAGTVADQVDTQLLAALSTDRPLNSAAYFRSIAKLGVQVAEALDHAHQHGIVHRDIKPSNLMLDTTGKLWVTDFGLAQIESDANLTMTGDVLGTLRYMSPEQALGKRGVVDQRSDVYSLGATLYELLTLEPVISGNDRRELFQKIADAEPRPLRSRNRDIPDDLETIVLKSLSKEPLERYATAGELADDLQRFLNHGPIRAKRPSLSVQLTKWTQRHPTTTVAMLTAMAALLVMSVGLVIHTVRVDAVNKQLTATISERDNANEDLGEANLALDAANSDLGAALDESQRNELRFQLLLYANDMKFADQAIRDGDLQQASELLRRHRPKRGGPDHRGVEWHYLKSQIEVDHIDLPGHVGAATYVCRSPDGRWIATAGDDGIVRILDAATYEEHRTLETGEETVNGVAFSPDGRMLASASNGGRVHVWDLNSHSEPRIIQAHEGDADAVVFTQDSARLVTSGNEPTIRIWNPHTGEATGTLEGHTRGSEALALSPDGQILGSASDDGSVKLWDVGSGPELLTLKAPGRLVTIDFSPDGSLVAAGGTGREVHIWEIATGERVSFEPHVDRVASVAFSPDGAWIATADRGGTVRMWRLNPDSGESRSDDAFVWTAHEGRAYSVCFSPDGGSVISVGEDGAMTAWSPLSRVLRKNLRNARLTSHSISDFTFTPDSRFLVTVDDNGGPRLWDPVTGTHVSTLEKDQRTPSAVAVSPKGKIAAVGDLEGYVQLWDLENRSLLTEWDSDEFGIAYRLVFSPDGARLAVEYGYSEVVLFDALSGKRVDGLPSLQGSISAFSPDNARLASTDETWIDVWDLATGEKLHTLQGHTTTIRGIAYSPDGRWLASGSEDRNVILWNAATGKTEFILTGHHAPVTCLAFAPDGRSLLSADASGALKFWHVATGQPLCDLEQQPHGYFRIAFSPDGRRLAWKLYGNGFGILDLMNSDKSLAPVPQRVLRGHTAPVEQMRLSPDGKTIASGSNDGTIKLWDMASGSLLNTLRHPGGGTPSVAFHPDGKRLASGGWDGTVRIWDLETAAEVQRHEANGVIGSTHFNREGSVLFTSELNNVIRYWDINSGQQLYEIHTEPPGSSPELYGMLLNPDCQRLATASPASGLKLWNVARREIERTWPEALGVHAGIHAFSDDGKLLVSGMSPLSEMQLLDTETGQTLQEFAGHAAPLSMAAFSPDDRWLASTYDDGTIRLWDVQIGELLLTWLGHPGGSDKTVFCPCFTPDGNTLVTCGADNTVRIWDLPGVE